MTFFKTNAFLHINTQVQYKPPNSVGKNINVQDFGGTWLGEEVESIN